MLSSTVRLVRALNNLKVRVSVAIRVRLACFLRVLCVLGLLCRRNVALNLSCRSRRLNVSLLSRSSGLHLQVTRVLLLSTTLRLRCCQANDVGGLGVILLYRHVDLEQFAVNAGRRLRAIGLLRLLVISNSRSHLVRTLRLRTVVRGVARTMRYATLFRLFFDFLSNDNCTRTRAAAVVCFCLRCFAFVLVAALTFSKSLMVVEVQKYLTHSFFESTTATIAFVFAISPN